MADFSPEGLLAAAKARYKEQVLRDRMTGAGGNGPLADAQLLEIARSVLARVKAVAQMSVGWPLPGVDPDTSIAYRVTWPKNVLQKALELFAWRTFAGFEGISMDQRKVGEAAEAFFKGLISGAEAWGIASDSDVGSPAPASARDRQGKALIAGIPDRSNALDVLAGPVWDSL